MPTKKRTTRAATPAKGEQLRRQRQHKAEHAQRRQAEIDAGLVTTQRIVFEHPVRIDQTRLLEALDDFRLTRLGEIRGPLQNVTYQVDEGQLVAYGDVQVPRSSQGGKATVIERGVAFGHLEIVHSVVRAVVHTPTPWALAYFAELEKYLALFFPAGGAVLPAKKEPNRAQQRAMNRAKEAQRLRAESKTYKEIAKALNVTLNTVSSYLSDPRYQ